MMYTSGTTGRPKGVYRARPIAAPPAWGEAPLKKYDRDRDVNLCCGPAYHAAPLAFDIIQPMVAGITIVLMEKFDPEEWLRMVETYRVTHCHMVSTMFQRILALLAEVKATLRPLQPALHPARLPRPRRRSRRR